MSTDILALPPIQEGQFKLVTDENNPCSTMKAVAATMQYQ